MVWNKILILAFTGLILQGCVYSTELGCEGFKDAGRSCKPVSSNVEYAVELEQKSELLKTEKNTATQKNNLNDLISYSIKLGDKDPLTTKAKTIKVTILPYVDEAGRLHMTKDIYLIIQKPEWVLGDYLIPEDSEAVK